MRIPLVLLAALAAGALGACGSSGSTTDTSGAPAGDPLIRFQVTGGLVGVNQVLEIDADGAATVTSGFRESSTTAHFQVSQGEVDALSAQLDHADLGSLPTSQTGCADCFEYEITYGGETYKADEISVPKELRPVIPDLTKLIAEHGSGAASTVSGK